MADAAFDPSKECRCGGVPEIIVIEPLYKGGREEYQIICSKRCGRCSWQNCHKKEWCWPSWNEAQGRPGHKPNDGPSSGQYWCFAFDGVESQGGAADFVGYASSLDEAKSTCEKNSHGAHEVWQVVGDPPHFEVVARGGYSYDNKSIDWL